MKRVSGSQKWVRLLGSCGSVIWLQACSLEETPPKPPPPATPQASGTASNGDTTGQGDAVPASGASAAVNTPVAEKSFTTTSEQKASLSWLGKYTNVDQELTLARQRTGQSAFFKQKDRTFLYDLFIQGTNGTPVTTRFALSHHDADPSDIRITVNNVAVSPQSFQFDATNAIVIFNQTPPLNAMIYVYYKLVSGLQTAFSLGTSIDPATIEVTVNGVSTKGFTYDAAGGSLTFSPPPTDAATISVNYTLVGAPILQYAVLVPDDGLANLMAFPKSDATKKFAITYTAGQVTFIAGEFVDGTAVVVRYYKDDEAQTLTLPNAPLANTLAMDLGATKCTKDQFTVTASAITTTCLLPEDAPVAVTYSYISAYNQTFSMADAMPKVAGDYVWKVWVGGTERTDFTTVENVVTFAKALPAGQPVIVRIFHAS